MEFDSRQGHLCYKCIRLLLQKAFVFVVFIICGSPTDIAELKNLTSAADGNDIVFILIDLYKSVHINLEFLLLSFTDFLDTFCICMSCIYILYRYTNTHSLHQDHLCNVLLLLLLCNLIFIIKILVGGGEWTAQFFLFFINYSTYFINLSAADTYMRSYKYSTYMIYI